MNNSYFWRMSPLRRLIWLKFGAGGGGSSILKTVTGALLHITDALAKPAKKFVATLEPIQDLHGQDSPYPAGGGKNLLPQVGQNDTYVNVIVSYDSSTETYTLNGTANATGNINLAIIPKNNLKWIEDSTYTISCRVVGGSLTIPSGSGNTYALSIFNTGSSKFIRGAVNLSESGLDGYSATGSAFTSSSNFTIMLQTFRSGITFNNLKLKVQIESGSSASAWSPYSNLCPITGHTGASVVRTGVNVWDEEVESGTLNIITGEEVSNGGIIRAKNFIPVVSGKEYYVVTGTYGFWTLFYDASKTVITDGLPYGAGKVNNARRFENGYKITIPDKCSYIRWYFRPEYGTTYLNDTSINYPSTDTSYHAYTGTTIPVTFPASAGTVYGGTLTNEGGEWKLRVARAIKEYDGSNDETWNYSSSYAKTNTVVFYSEVVRDAYYPDWNYSGIISNLFVGVSRNYLYSADTPCASFTGNANIDPTTTVRILKTVANDVSSFRAFLENNPLQFCYELATPIEYTLTESQALTLLKGENNIWVDDSDSLELTYLAKAEEATP